jgi:hypothetical protein
VCSGIGTSQFSWAYFGTFPLNALFVEMNLRIAFSNLSFHILALIDYYKYTVVLECSDLFTDPITFQ